MTSNFLWSSAGPGELIGSASVAAGNLLTMAGHSLTNGQQVTVTDLQGGAKALEEAAPYWVRGAAGDVFPLAPRSEEHTSELQSRENLVCRLLLEKTNKKTI